MIRNTTKNKVLANKAVFARSMFEKMIGLMFKSKINYGLVFIFNIEKKVNFHTCFMNFPIDFIFLSEKMKVLKTVHNVKPFRMNIFGVGKYVVELKAGDSLNTSVGDTISFK